MTAQKQYELSYAALRSYIEAKDYKIDPSKDMPILRSLASMSDPGLDALLHLLDDARASMDKANGKAKPLSAAKEIIRNAERFQSHREDLHGVWTDKQGRTCVCDGYHAMRFTDVLASLDSVPGMDLEPIFTDDLMHSAQSFDLPSIAELKAIIFERGCKRTSKDREAIRYSLADDKPDVNIFYLLDILTGLSNPVVHWNGRLNGTLYFTGDNGDAVLCPIHKRYGEAA